MTEQHSIPDDDDQDEAPERNWIAEGQDGGRDEWISVELHAEDEDEARAIAHHYISDIWSVSKLDDAEAIDYENGGTIGNPAGIGGDDPDSHYTATPCPHCGALTVSELDIPVTRSGEVYEYECETCGRYVALDAPETRTIRELYEECADGSITPLTFHQAIGNLLVAGADKPAAATNVTSTPFFREVERLYIAYEAGDLTARDFACDVSALMADAEEAALNNNRGGGR